MSDSIHPCLRHPHQVTADYAPTEMKKALRRWSEEQWLIRAGLKAFLMQLVHHADEEAQVYVPSLYFQYRMNLSPRTITYYLRDLETERLIEATGRFVRIKNGRLATYRLAPCEDEIDMLAARPEHFATLPSCSTVGDESTRMARLISALEAFPPELVNEFHDRFGTAPLNAYLVPSAVCLNSGRLIPTSEDARSWFAADTSHFFAQWGVSVGEVRKTRSNG